MNADEIGVHLRNLRLIVTLNHQPHNVFATLLRHILNIPKTE